MYIKIKDKYYVCEQGFLQTSKSKISYYKNCPKSVKRVIFLFPPGASNATFYVSTFKNFKDTDLLISINYPGRGVSTVVKNNSVENLASIVGEFINTYSVKNKIKKFTLFGISYGGSTALESVKYLKNSQIERIILVSTGEFLRFHDRCFLLPLVYIAERNKSFRLVLFRLNKKVKLMADFPFNNLKTLFKQFYGGINYKISYSSKINIPATIVWYKRDNILRRDSKQKIENLFDTKKVIVLNKKSHKITHREITREFIENVLPTIPATV